MGQRSSQKNTESIKAGNIVAKILNVLLLIYIVTAILLRCFVDAFTWHWFIFGLIIVLTPPSVVYTFEKVSEKNKLSSKQIKASSYRVFLLILYIWICDLLYMCIFNQWKIGIWIVGLLILVLNTLSLTNNFLSNKKEFKVVIPFDLLIAIGIAVYLIYIIPENTLRDIVTTITAAFFGGLLTLVGVAWTIKKSDNDRKEVEKKQAKPYFTFNMRTSELILGDSSRVCFNDSGRDTHIEAQCEIENSCQSVFTIKRVFNDGKWENIVGNNVVLQNKIVGFSLKCNGYFNKYLEVEDVLGNVYYYSFKILMFPLKNNTIFYTMNQLQEVTDFHLKSEDGTN